MSSLRWVHLGQVETLKESGSRAVVCECYRTTHGQHLLSDFSDESIERLVLWCAITLAKNYK